MNNLALFSLYGCLKQHEANSRPTNMSILGAQRAGTTLHIKTKTLF